MKRWFRVCARILAHPRGEAAFQARVFFKLCLPEPQGSIGVSPLGSLSNVYTKHKIEFHLTTLHTYWSPSESLMKKLQFYTNLFLNPGWHIYAQVKTSLRHIQHSTGARQTRRSHWLSSSKQQIFICHLLCPVFLVGTGHTAVSRTEESLLLGRHSNQIYCSLETKTALKGIWGNLNIDCILQHNYLGCANSIWCRGFQTCLYIRITRGLSKWYWCLGPLRDLDLDWISLECGLSFEILSLLKLKLWVQM